MKRLGLLILAAVFLMGQSPLPLPPPPYDPLEQLQRDSEWLQQERREQIRREQEYMIEERRHRERQELLERQLEELKRHDPYYSN
jgi:hypothetical protein